MVWEAGVIASVLALLSAAAIFALISVAGGTIVRRFLGFHPLTPWLGAAVGWALVSYLMLAAGFTIGYGSIVWLNSGLMATAAGLIAWDWWHYGGQWRQMLRQLMQGVWPADQSRLDQLIRLLVGLLWLGTLLSALAPSTGWDANTYHLNIPKQYLLAGQIVPLETIAASYFQLLPQMQYLFLLGLNLPLAAQLLPSLYLLSLLLLIGQPWVGRLLLGLSGTEKAADRSRETVESTVVSQQPATLALALLASVPAVWFASYEILVDVPALVYLTLACLMLAEARVNNARRYAVAAAILVGLLVGAKVTNILFLLFFPVVMFALSSAGSLLARYKAALGYTLIAALVTLPWYLHGWMMRGNPLWPYFEPHLSPQLQQWAGLSLLAGIVLVGVILRFRQSWSGKQVAILFLALVSLALLLLQLWPALAGLRTIFWTRLVEAIVGPVLMTYFPERFGGDAPRIGPLLLTLLPLLWLTCRLGERGARYFRLVVGCWFLFFYTSWLLLFDLNDTRHLMVIFPVLVWYLAMGWQRLSERFPHARFGAGVFAAIVVFSLIYSLMIVGKVLRPRLPVILGQVDHVTYLSEAEEPLYPGVRKIPEFAAQHFANQNLEENAKILMVGEFQWYYLDRIFLNGRPDQQSLLDYAQYSTPAALWGRLRALEVDYLMTYQDPARLEDARLAVLFELLAGRVPVFVANGVVIYQLDEMDE